jgi:hypothetical protein
MKTGDVKMLTMTSFITRLTLLCFLQFTVSAGMAASYSELLEVEPKLAHPVRHSQIVEDNLAKKHNHFSQTFTRLKKRASNVVRSTASFLTTGLNFGVQALLPHFTQTSPLATPQNHVQETTQPVGVTIDTDHDPQQKHRLLKYSRRQKLSPQSACILLGGLLLFMAGEIWYAMTPHTDFDAVYFDVYKKALLLC